jgi:type IV pilus assembly protein PilN
MIRINLLPVREARRKAGLRQQGILLGGAAGAGVVLVLGLHLQIGSEISNTRAQIVATEGEFQRLRGTLEKIEHFRRQKENIQRKLSVISDLEASRSGPTRILDEIATRIPDRMWLTSLSLRGGSLELTGYGLDNEIIAAFMTSLEESDYLKEVELLETKLEDKSTLKLNGFKIRSRESRPPSPDQNARH